MEQFATEDQQVEAIKRFWKENGIAVVVGAVLGLGGLFGWRYYSDAQLASKEAASMEYQAVVEALQTEDGVERAKTFLDENSGSGYGTLTAFVLASQAVASEDYASAQAHLEEAAKTSDSAIRPLALLRLARVQLAQDNAQAALDSVNKVENDAFVAQTEEVKGDAYVKLGNFDQARLAYGAAVEADAANQLVKMKLDNLAVASGS